MSSQAGNPDSTGDNNNIAVTPDGLIRKTILTEGEGDPAGRGAKVTVKYKLKRTESTNDDEVIDASDRRPNGTLTFTQGRKKVLPALDVIVPTMKRGEVAKAIVGPTYAFGSRGLPRKGVAPDTSIHLEVELVDFAGGEIKKSLPDMTPRERLEEAKACKEAGNVLFKEAKYEKAMIQYSQCIRYVANVFYDDGASQGRKSNNKELANGEKNNKSDAADVKGEGEEGFTEAVVKDDDDEKEEEEEAVETLDVSTATSSSVQDKGDTNSKAVSEGGDDRVEAHEGDGKTNDADLTNGHQESDQNPTEDEDEASQDNPSKEEVQSLHVTVLNNLSLCLVKMEQYKQAVETASLALQLDPESSKAYYHRYVEGTLLLKVHCERVIILGCCKYLSVHCLTFFLPDVCVLLYPMGSPEGVPKYHVASGTRLYKISKQRRDYSLKIWESGWRLPNSKRSGRVSRIWRRSKLRRCLLKVSVMKIIQENQTEVNK